VKNLVFAASVALLLSACAGGPSQKADVPVPTYTEKVSAITLNEFKPSTSCPSDAKFKGQDWRKMVSFANACVKAKDWRKVEAIGNELAINAHLTPWGPYFLSLAAQSRKDYPRATWMLELALKKAPKEGIFHYQLGRLNWEMGDDAAALKELKLASEMNPSLTDAHYVMGQLALRKDNYSEAEKLFRKTLALDDKHWPATMGLASAAMKSGDWAKAEEVLSHAVSMNPRSMKARLALAQVQEMHLKKVAEALHTYRELRAYAQQNKLDETVQVNLDEKIQTLEKSTSQVNKGSQVTERAPTAAAKKKVTK
jgi:tetratricopeptide (TPR) repeat protein